MARVLKVDLSQVRALTRRAERHLGEVEDVLADVVEDAAASLRENDRYQDRTGDLRASTQGEAIDFGETAEATMAMEMPYASFVIGRGFSDWEDAIEDAERQADDAFDGLATKITR